MTPTIAVIVFPGTNSEDETRRALIAAGADADLVRSDAEAETLRRYDAYVLPGGFAYEDRIRAGAVAAHDPAMDIVIDAAQRGKLVLGICNGAQVLLEAGLVPGTGEARRPTAAYAPNLPSRRYVCRHVHVKLVGDPARSPILAGLAPDAVIPAWASHGEGRLAAAGEEIARVESAGLVAFRYANARGETTPQAIPNGSVNGVAAMLNRDGNVLAIMPHPERDAWNFMHVATATSRRAASVAPLEPSGGIALFRSFVAGVRAS